MVLVRIRLLLNTDPNTPSFHHKLVVFLFIIYLKFCVLLNNIIFAISKVPIQFCFEISFVYLPFSTPAGMPVSWIMIAPSVTPKKTNIGSNNPAMRLYKFDTDTGQVSTYTVFHPWRSASSSRYNFCLARLVDGEAKN